MKILDRYIRRTVISSTVTVMLGLIAIFTFFKFIDELEQVGQGHYGVLQVIEYVLLSIPTMAYEMFPMGALIGALLGLGTLMSNSEITVIRTSGVSLARTVFSVLKVAAILMAFAMLVGEFIAPPAEELARSQRSIALSDQITLKTRYGFWARDGHSFINIRKLLPAGQVEDIYIYEFDQAQQLRVSTHALRGRYKDGSWLLEDIVQTDLSGESLQRKSIQQAVWESLLKPELINIVVIKPNSLSIRDLIGYISYLNMNTQNALQYEQALWVKIIYPFACGIMVFLAIPMVLLGGTRTSSVGQRVVTGSVIGLVFHILNQASGHLGLLFELNPFLSAAAPTLLILSAAVLLVRRIH